MLDFTAIDFETANKYANSACSLAAVTMNDDRCVKEGYIKYLHFYQQSHL